jgi:peroxiredoxin
VRKLPQPPGEAVISTLTERLADLLASRCENPEWEAAYAQIIATLNREGFYQGMAGPGETFPDFLLPSATGHLINLADELARGPVVVTFFRGEWCPFCKLTTAALAEAAPRIEAAGARILALTPETGPWPLRLQQRDAAAFEVLSDIDFGVGLAAGLVFKIPPLYRARVQGLQLDLRHGNAAWCLPVPAVYVIGQDGVIAWRFADVDFSRRPEPDEILAALARLDGARLR